MARKSGMKYGFWKTKAGAEKGRKKIRETKGGWSGASVRKVIGPYGKGWGVARRGTWEPGWFFFKGGWQREAGFKAPKGLKKYRGKK